MTQKNIKRDIADLSHRKKVIAEAVQMLREEEARRKRELEDDFDAQRGVLLGIWEKDHASFEAVQKKCRSKFHKDPARSGRCPDCKLLKSIT